MKGSLKYLLLFLISFSCSVQVFAQRDNICDTPMVVLTVHPTCIFTRGTNNGTPSSFTSGPCSGVSSGDVWYKVIVPPGMTSLNFKVVGVTMSFPKLYVYTGNCPTGPYTPQGCQLFTTAASPPWTISSLIPGDVLSVRIGGSSGTFDICVYAGTVGTEDINSASPSVYIDPVNQLTVTGLLKFEKNTLTMYNLIGKKLFEVNVADGKIEEKIDIGRFAAGIYFVKIFNGKEWTTKKIVKSR